MYPWLSLLFCKNIKNTITTKSRRTTKHSNCNSRVGFRLYCTYISRQRWLSILYKFFIYILQIVLFCISYVKLCVAIDLSDGGASHIAETVKEIKKRYIIHPTFSIIVTSYFYNYISNKHFTYIFYVFEELIF